MIKRLFHYIQRKLSVRVSLWVVLFAAIVFNLALVFLFYQSREVVRQEAISRATQILDKTSLHVESILNRVEVASNMTKWLVERHANNADSIFVYSRGMLVTNPDFYNCSIQHKVAATTINTFIWIGICCLCCWRNLPGRSLTSTTTCR